MRRTCAMTWRMRCAISWALHASSHVIELHLNLNVMELSPLLRESTGFSLSSSELFSSQSVPGFEFKLRTSMGGFFSFPFLPFLWSALDSERQTLCKPYASVWLFCAYYTWTWSRHIRQEHVRLFHHICSSWKFLLVIPKKCVRGRSVSGFLWCLETAIALLARPFLHSAQFSRFLPGQGLLAGAVSALRFGKSNSRQFGLLSCPLPKCQSRRILPALEGWSGTHRTTRLPSVLSIWICRVLLPRSVSGQSTHSKRSWLLRGSCVRQGACWKYVALRGQGNAASWLSELHRPFSVGQILSSRSQTHYSSVSTRCTDQSHQCWIRWVRAMSVQFLVELCLVQPCLAQLHRPGLAEQCSLLVLGMGIKCNSPKQI